MSIDYPLPVIDVDSEPYWSAALEGRLAIQRCPACAMHIFYPRALCPYCHAAEPDWVEASGYGRIYSFTVARRPAGPAFASDVPYVIGLVDLDEGPRMMSNLSVQDISLVSIGRRVCVQFESIDERIALPRFALCEEEAGNG